MTTRRVTMTTAVLAVLALLQLGCGDGSTFVVADAVAEDASSAEDVAADVSTSESGDATAGDTADETSRADTAEPPEDVGVPCTDLSAKPFGGHCYFPLVPMEWLEAKKACAAKGAHLVVITSLAEHAFVKTFGGITDRHIGLERAAGAPLLKESYAWITGEKNVIDQWALTEPNGSGPCGEIRPDGLWGDTPCASLFPGLCERE